MLRKVEGERKGAAHGDGEGVFDGSSVPLRRWEDWERSRLRKIKREERRRREMERAFPSGFHSNGNLGIRSEVSSTYDGSDTISVTSSEEDVWGTNIGAYNENSPAYPPPPTGVLLPRNDVLQSADTVGASDLEAMLESGFDSDQNFSRQNLLTSSSTSSGSLPRYQLSDGPMRLGNGAAQYSPLSRTEGGPVHAPPVMSPVTPTGPNAVSSAVGRTQTHVRQRSGGRNGPSDYGPLGPLDPGNRL